MDILTSWPLGALLLTLIVVIGLGILVRFERRQILRSSGDRMMRREMIDECFSKGQMTRRQCEGGRSNPG